MKNFEIYVDLDDTGNSRSQTMDNLMKEQKVSFGTGISVNISFRGFCFECASYCYVFIRNIYDNYTGNHIKWLFRGMVICSQKKGESESHIQIDKNSETLTVTWAYDSDSFGADAYLEHGKAQITAIEGVSEFFNSVRRQSGRC